jgi:hypothetical protein
VTPRRFKLEIDGTEFFCAAFESAQALEAALTGQPQIGTGVDLTQAVPERVEADVRSRGRPSFDDLIGEAVQALQLDPRATLADRVRRVLRHLAETCDASEIPGTRTVERYLAERPVRQKPRQKSRQKSSRAKITRTGG